MREAIVERETRETSIKVKMNLDGKGNSKISTGIGFLDHMLTLLSFHGDIDLEVNCNGDLEVDDHHTVEDVALTLGEAFKKAIGNKVGIKRYSCHYIPMDESLARVVIDISNRPYLIYNVIYTREKVGELDTQNIKEFFKSFVNEAKLTLHIEVLYGENDHHKVESIFKAFGRSLKESITCVTNTVSSTKGVL